MQVKMIHVDDAWCWCYQDKEGWHTYININHSDKMQAIGLDNNAYYTLHDQYFDKATAMEFSGVMRALGEQHFVYRNAKNNKSIMVCSERFRDFLGVTQPPEKLYFKRARKPKGGKP